MNFKLITAGIVCMVATASAFAQTTAEDPMIERTAPKKKYADNVLAAAPIQMSENGVAGFGLSYEHTLDRAGIISLYVPVSLVLSNRNQNNYYGNNNNDPMFYVMPGIKIYPTGNQGVAKYAIGPSIVAAVGSETQDITYYLPYASYAPVSSYQRVNRALLGMMVNQSLNINPTPHLYIGTELGIGFSYLNRVGTINESTTGLVQFSFKVGYRF